MSLFFMLKKKRRWFLPTPKFIEPYLLENALSVLFFSFFLLFYILEGRYPFLRKPALFFVLRKRPSYQLIFRLFIAIQIHSFFDFRY